MYFYLWLTSLSTIRYLCQIGFGLSCYSKKKSLKATHFLKSSDHMVEVKLSHQAKEVTPGLSKTDSVGS